MGLYNKYAEYNTEDEAAKRRATMEAFLKSNETHLLMLDENKDDREDCADCLYPDRKCSECINGAKNKRGE